MGSFYYFLLSDHSLMGLSTAPSLFYFEVGFSWIITSPLLSPIVTYTNGFFEGLSFQLAFASLFFWYASLRSKDHRIFHPCGFFHLSKDSLVVSLVVVNLSIYVVELSLGIHPSFRIHSLLWGLCSGCFIRLKWLQCDGIARVT